MKIPLNFSNFSLRGWWGQPMSLFWKLVDETQMATLREYTDAFIIIKKLFLGGLWGLQSNSIWYERPCRCVSTYLRVESNHRPLPLFWLRFSEPTQSVHLKARKVGREFIQIEIFHFVKFDVEETIFNRLRMRLLLNWELWKIPYRFWQQHEVGSNHFHLQGSCPQHN